MESRQPCDEALSRYGEDFVWLLDASEIQWSRDRKHKDDCFMLHLSPCCRVWREHGWWDGHPEYDVFSQISLLLPPVTENQALLLSLPFSVHTVFPVPPSSLFTSSAPPFSTKTQVIWCNKRSPGPVRTFHHDVNDPRWWDGHTEAGDAQDQEFRHQGNVHVLLRFLKANLLICYLVGYFGLMCRPLKCSMNYSRVSHWHTL